MRSLSGLLKSSNSAMHKASVVFKTGFNEKALSKENAYKGEVTL
jgi:hypothetical protein